MQPGPHTGACAVVSLPASGLHPADLPWGPSWRELGRHTPRRASGTRRTAKPDLCPRRWARGSLKTWRNQAVVRELLLVKWG